MATIFEDESLVLFQGDSITDAGRNRGMEGCLGGGYAAIAASIYGALHPEKNVRFMNRGISGNRVHDLLDRWQADAIDLKPDWISLMIGINNVWRRYDSDDPTSVEDFEREYRLLLEWTKAELECGLILLEPFVLPHPPDRADWREDLDPKITVVRQLARDFEALYVPYDGLFAAACMQQECSYWASDGVHPTYAGHGLLAHHWLRVVGAVG